MSHLNAWIATGTHFWFVLCASALPLHAQPVSSPTTAMATAVAAEGLVGATWALVTPAGVTTGAAGFKHLANRTPMRADNRVQVGSITKTFIAVGVLRLVTEGRVALDTPVRHYLPDLPIDNPWEHEQPVLVRHRCALPAAV